SPATSSERDFHWCMKGRSCQIRVRSQYPAFLGGMTMSGNTKLSRSGDNVLQKNGQSNMFSGLGRSQNEYSSHLRLHEIFNRSGKNTKIILPSMYVETSQSDHSIHRFVL